MLLTQKLACPLKRNHSKRTFHLPSINFHRIRDMLVFRIVIVIIIIFPYIFPASFSSGFPTPHLPIRVWPFRDHGTHEIGLQPEAKTNSLKDTISADLKSRGAEKNLRTPAGEAPVEIGGPRGKYWGYLPYQRVFLSGFRTNHQQNGAAKL